MRFSTISLVAAASALAITVGCKPEKPSTDERVREARARVTAHQGTDPALAGEKVPEGKGKGLSEAERALVVAKIGDLEMTLGDVERQLASQPAFARARYRTFDKKVEFLHNLVQFELLAMEAQRRGYDTDPDVVLAMKKAMIQKFTANDLQKLVRVSEITPEEIQRFYDNNRSMFSKPEQLRASHILFEDEASARKAYEELKAAIEADRGKARVIFADFARRLSKDTESAFANGDLGFFSRGGYLDDEREDRLRLDEKFVSTAFSQPGVNGVSEPFETEHGWHVLQVTSRRPAIDRTVEDAKRQITNILLRQKKDGAREAYIASLRSKADVKLFEEPLKSLNVDEIERDHPHSSDRHDAAPPAAQPSETKPIDPSKRPTAVLRPHSALKPMKLEPEARQKNPASPPPEDNRRHAR